MNIYYTEGWLANENKYACVSAIVTKEYLFIKHRRKLS